ncbi:MULTISPECIES: hypothetical protein [Petrotoga]|uniref:Outer membrane lipoprotein-sorting protein n=2 Tax=Petrotoga sibirica TaxID=156202 RepID=A0A4R8F2C0_9BACT|nr:MULTISPECIES: hypothetical protein [Petrotoga]KUK83538.1 MAG: Uncharacterized protein XD96_0297 [Petrotoga mobilis]POZ89463.1 hypothetical protein AA80_00495 [Petrotoga sibirica DSM 13575]POZ91905.1 hypothetical protein AD60_00495 [Petrotoga sp. SL27]TDX16271.1 hypothetical protein C8D74_10490 [Petrotoga sibirica]
MTIKKYLLFSFLAFSTFIYAQPNLESLLESYLGYKKLKFEVDIQFQITESKEISAELRYIDNRYLIFSFEKPSLFKDIYYCYDFFESVFYTNIREEVDEYDQISIRTATIPDLISSFLPFFNPENFDVIVIEEGVYEIQEYLPKTRNFLKLVNIDFTKFNIYYFKPFENIKILEKLEILNSQENKKIIINIKEIRPLSDEEADAELKKVLLS